MKGWGAKFYIFPIVPLVSWERLGSFRTKEKVRQAKEIAF